MKPWEIADAVTADRAVHMHVRRPRRDRWHPGKPTHRYVAGWRGGGPYVEISSGLMPIDTRRGRRQRRMRRKRRRGWA